jgi:hypothetical protein
VAGLIFFGVFTMGWSGYGIFGYVKMLRNSQFLHNLIFLVSILVFCAFFMLGLLFFLVPFTTYITLSPTGIEYHTLGRRVKAKWTNVRIEMPKDTLEKIKIFHLIDPEVIIQPWNVFVPWKVKSDDTDNILRITQFGGLTSEKLIEDIQRFAPYLGMH